MKKVLVISLSLYSAVVTVLLLKDLTAHAVGGGGVPVGNGDVNGDGMIDVSDGVYILSWLFTGGSPPIAIDPPSPSCFRLLATNQTRCYSPKSNAPMDCNFPPALGQDSYYKLGCPSQDRFVDNGDNTVFDKCTGLCWTKFLDINEDYEITVEGDSLNWADSITYIENLNFAGHDDWRLPNAMEMISLFNFDSQFSIEAYPILGTWFNIWSSTTNTKDLSKAWILVLGRGWPDEPPVPLVPDSKTTRYFVVGVRNAE